MALITIAAAVVAAAIAGTGAWVARAPRPAEPIAFTVETSPTQRPESFAISPDGRHLAFSALDKDGQEKLWVRSIGSIAAHVLPGTESAVLPFWSPDSRTIAFFSGSELKRIDVAGGGVQSICRTSTAASVGGSWSGQNVILFARRGNGLFQVPASGGEPQRVTTINAGAGETSHEWPAFLPDGRHFVYLKVIQGGFAGGYANSQVIWRALDSPDERVVRKMYSRVFYSPAGYLLFRLAGPIVAQSFDASNGNVSGDPVQVVSDVSQRSGSETALAFSPAGVLAYRTGIPGAVAQLSWIDRDGKVLTVVGAAGDYRNPSIDPGGERVVANTIDPADVWLLDSRRGTTSRITFDPAIDSDEVFSPDGRWVAFYSARQPMGIYRKASSGAGADELVAATGLGTYPRDWSPDGRFLLYDNGAVGGLWALPMEGDRKPFRYPATQSNESRSSQGHFSPDTKWVAYASEETGRQDVFVQDFPSTGAKFQVSIAGGSEPRWRRDGRELYFIAADGRMMSVDVEIKPEFRLGVPKPLFQTRLMNLVPPSRRFGVSADGKRFLMNVPVGDDALAPITVIMNWTAGLKK